MKFKLAILFTIVALSATTAVVILGESGGGRVFCVTDIEFAAVSDSLIVSHLEGRESLFNSAILESSEVLNLYDRANGSLAKRLNVSSIANANRIDWILLSRITKVATRGKRTLARLGTHGAFWDSEKPPNVYHDLGCEVLNFAVSDEDSLIFVADARNVKALNIENRQLIWSTSASCSYGSLSPSVAFSRCLQMVAIGAEDSVALVDCNSGLVTSRIPVQELIGVCFVDNECCLAFIQKNAIVLYDIEHKRFSKYHQTEDEIRAFSFSRDGKYCAMVSDAGFTIVEIETGVGQHYSRIADITSICFSQDNSLLAYGDSTGHITLMNLESEEIIWSRICAPKVRRQSRVFGLVATACIFAVICSTKYLRNRFDGWRSIVVQKIATETDSVETEK